MQTSTKNISATTIKNAAKILDAWLPHKIQKSHIPGLSVGIVYKNKLVYQKGFGWADMERKKKTLPETTYRIASISKTFTAVAILQLVESGKLQLDDTVTQYLPWFQANNKKIQAKDITVRQLLSHSSGVFRDGVTPHWIDDHFPNHKQLQASVSNNMLVFQHSVGFKYSNFGFALLGEIIREISGVSYNEYISKNILDKLALKNTFPDFSTTTKKELSNGYGRIILEREREVFAHIKTHAYTPATGFISNVPDLAKYLPALFSSKTSNTILTEVSKQEMMKGEFPINEEGEQYGLGVRIEEIEKRKIFGHGGSFPGYSTKISYDKENEIGVIVLCNTIDANAALFNKGIFETIYRLHALKKQSNKIEINKYEGLYRSRWGDNVVLGINGQLMVFDPSTDSPLKYNSSLLYSGKGLFIIETKNNFWFRGEPARFLFQGRRKATTMILGTWPNERIE
ncbi:MAG: Beta-lactamase protein [Patescibacteria group bacterium]|nr:Beta-lactamase protein [Patescibacteria group bacterium]